MREKDSKGRVCVTGGTGFLGSWLVKKLLQYGYSVNTTTRIDPERKRDTSYLTSLPGASERLHIFDADLDRPDSFSEAIDQCVGVFHVAHPLDFDDKETEEVKIQRVTKGTTGILQACVDSKTVRRVVVTSSVAAVAFNEKAGGSEPIDESCWTNVEILRSLGVYGESYMVSKTVTERIALDFGEKHGLDIVTILPSWIHGPFICSYCPDSVLISMSLILGNKKYYQSLVRASLVHIDDVVRAHIHLFEYPNAKGRYICSAVESTIQKLHQFLSVKYPQFELQNPDSLIPVAFPGFTTKKLLDTGFEYENGLEEMFDGAIESCKRIDLL